MCPVAPMTTTRLMFSDPFQRLTNITIINSERHCRVNSRSERPPDGGALDIAVFQRAQTGNVVGGQRRQPVPGQVGPPEVTDQDIGAAGPASGQEPRYAAGQLPFV